LIEVHDLTKHYGPHKALIDANFKIDTGEIVGFLGPNGAGKSTTMNILTGYLSSTSGDVVIDGKNILDYPEDIKRKIGYLPENPPLYLEMLVDEFLKFACEIKKVPKKKAKERIEEVVDTVGIRNVRRRLIKNLSKGYKQRVGLAQALIGDPDILIFDEPTAGLDPAQIIEIRSLIKKLGENHTVVLSSHILPEVAAVCKRVLIINEGRIVADDDPITLAKRLFGTGELMLRAAADAAAVKKALTGLPHVKKITEQDSQEPESAEFIIEAEKEFDLRKDIFFAMSKANLPIILMRSIDRNLEEIFLHLTTREEEVR
jgi:ABC-2 type transport system ATP-binding protein